MIHESLEACERAYPHRVEAAGGGELRVGRPGLGVGARALQVYFAWRRYTYKNELFN